MERIAKVPAPPQSSALALAHRREIAHAPDRFALRCEASALLKTDLQCLLQALGILGLHAARELR